MHLYQIDIKTNVTLISLEEKLSWGSGFWSRHPRAPGADPGPRLGGRDVGPVLARHRAGGQEWGPQQVHQGDDVSVSDAGGVTECVIYRNIMKTKASGQQTTPLLMTVPPRPQWMFWVAPVLPHHRPRPSQPRHRPLWSWGKRRLRPLALLRCLRVRAMWRATTANGHGWGKNWSVDYSQTNVRPFSDLPIDLRGKQGFLFLFIGDILIMNIEDWI